jgi:hypothetical protein
MKIALRLAAVLVVVLASGCDGSSRVVSRDSRAPSRAAISDQAHGGGTPGFFFLPPLARATAYGVFQRNLRPEVIVEELAPGTRGVVARFSATAGTVRESIADEHYLAIWNTRASALDPALTYRIHVRLEGEAFELGFADVDVVSSGSELRKVDTDEMIPLLGGSTLPIMFRIDRDALKCVGVSCSAIDACHLAGTCDTHTGTCSNPQRTDGLGCVGPAGGSLPLPGGGTLTVPAGALTGNTWLEATLLSPDLVDQLLASAPFALHPRRALFAYRLQPDGLVFRVPATLSVPIPRLDGLELPVHMTVDLASGTFGLDPGEFRYDGLTGVLEMRLAHFSEQTALAATPGMWRAAPIRPVSRAPAARS